MEIENRKMSKEQEELLDAVRSVHMANKLMGKDLNELYVQYHYQAIDGTPGWNIFLNNIRFEMGNKLRVRFSLPITDEREFEQFSNFLEETVRIRNYSVDHRLGIKYMLEIDFDNNIYEEEGLSIISQLTDKILEYVKYV